MKTLLAILLLCCLTAFSLPSFSEETNDSETYILTVVTSSYRLSSGGVESNVEFQETSNEIKCTRLARSVVIAFKKLYKLNSRLKGEIETSCDPK